MTIELKVPEAGESITEAEIVEWLKSEGDSVEEDESVVVLESEKASQELPCPAAGVLKKILKQAGETVSVGEVIGHVEESQATGEESESEERNQTERDERPESEDGQRKEPGALEKDSDEKRTKDDAKAEQGDGREESGREESGREESGREESGREESGREEKPEKRDAADDSEPDETPSDEAKDTPEVSRAPAGERDRHEERVPLTPLRRHLAERLVEAMRTSALLTTFNEIDMSRVIQLRRTLSEEFSRRHDVKLGFMSFFVKAVVDALNRVPELNARIEEENIVYCNYQDIGVAVGSGKGLVVPVLRDAHSMSFAAIELAIQDFAERASERELRPEELRGGTFTISNGGVYGSLLSTPIVNPPQSGILGMHRIEERPVARDGEVKIRPMMYVALTYDHRIVDGREAVTFLQRVKESIEEPSRMLIEV